MTPTAPVAPPPRAPDTTRPDALPGLSSPGGAADLSPLVVRSGVHVRPAVLVLIPEGGLRIIVPDASGVRTVEIPPAALDQHAELWRGIGRAIPAVLGDANCRPCDRTPGAYVTARPDVVANAIPERYAAIPRGLLLSDPCIGRALQQCRSAAEANQAQVTVFVPMQQALRPQLEQAPAQAAPDTKAEAANKPAPDKPSAAADRSADRNAGADNTRPAQARSSELGEHTGETHTRLQHLDLEARKQLASSRSGATLSDAARGDAGLLREHQLYSELRGRVSLTLGDEVELLRGRGAGEAQAWSDAKITRTLEHLLRLDRTAGEYFARPGWQRESQFQRAAFMALLTTGAPIDAVFKELSQMFGLRFGLDREAMGQLALSYGLAGGGAEPGAPERTPREALGQSAQEQAARAKERGKTERLPEEMLVEQRRERAVTGAKQKKRDISIGDRVHGIDEGRHDADDEETDAEQLWDDGEDEDTAPIVLDKTS